MKSMCLLLAQLVVHLVLFEQICALSLSRTSRSPEPVDVQVLSPGELRLDLPEGRLVNIKVNVNRDISGTTKEVAEFERNETDGRVLVLSADHLNLKKGDLIFYNGVFVKNERPFGEGGVHVFDGVFPNTRQKRDSINEPLETPQPPGTQIKTRFGGRKPRHGPPRDRFHPPGPHHRHFDHHGPPPFPYKPGSWGHKFGEHGPWDGHSDEDDFYGGHLDDNQPWDHHGFKEDKPHGVRGGRKPNGGVEKPVVELPDRIDDTKPSGRWDVSDTNSGNQGTKPVGNGKVTTTSTVVPQIDIRFPEVDDD